jgi:uncharacterized protein
MSIAWDSFTPMSALIGGALIGLAASVLALFNGRVAGVSGIVGGLIAKALRSQPSQDVRDWAWRLAFTVGMMLAPFGYLLATKLPSTTITASTATLIIAGLLVGFGSRVGNGCTSGHGVCGLARFSKRSLAATLTFMGSAMATVVLMKAIQP